MKKFLSVLLIAAMMTSLVSALADDRGTKYTMEVENMVTLQNSPDREISYNEADLAPNPVIPGESTTTGQPLKEGLPYMPMLVQISNPSYAVKYEDPESGKTKKAVTAGVGERAPWGGQYADIVYEGILYRTGQTRITFVISDSFADDEPQTLGPVRSARIGHVLLREEWMGGLVFHGGPEVDDNNIHAEFKRLGANEKGVVFDLAGSNRYNDYWYRVDGIASADNVNIDVIGLRNTIPETTVAEPHPFLFSDTCAYLDGGYETAYGIHLDWGHEEWISHLYYDEGDNLYLRYSGPVPYMTYMDADRNEDDMEQMSFSNVIIQRVPYEYAHGNKIMPVMQAVGKGNADIFIGGRYIPGYWVRESETSPTVFFDDKGNELVLTRGRTYIAHFPVEGLVGYTQEGLN